MNFTPKPCEAPIVRRLRRAGAILLGKAVTTEFAGPDPSRTVNPWNPDRTPGGSSSGSAAAVAARMVPVALGTQTAGSVLRPAAYCGVVGFKPTLGLVGTAGIFPFAWSLDTLGIIATTAADAAWMGAAVVGAVSVRRALEETAQKWSQHLLNGRWTKRSGAPAVRIGILTDFSASFGAGGRRHIESVGRQLAAQGAEVAEVAFATDVDMLYAACSIIVNVEVAAVHGAAHAKRPDSYGPGMLTIIGAGQQIPGHAYVNALRVRERLRRAFLARLRDYDAIILPTVPGDGPNATTTGDFKLQVPFTFLGLPAVAFPSGLSDDGLPLSTQVVARPMADDVALSVAAWAESVLCVADQMRPPLRP